MTHKLTCNHIGRNNNKCKNYRLGESMFCYLKSHHSDADAYEKIIEKQYQNYITNTIDHSHFTLKDVVGDGACLYRCFVIYLLYNLQNLVEVNKPMYEILSKNVNEFFQLKFNSSIDIINMHPDQYKTFIDEIFDNRMIEVNYLFINKLAKIIQVALKTWLVEHKDLTIEELGGFTIENLIQNCHDITIEQYEYLYDIFAGENDFLYVKTDENDDASTSTTSVSNSASTSTTTTSTSTSTTTSASVASTSTSSLVSEAIKDGYKKMYIPDRWGSSSEIYGFSGMFGGKVNIYVIKRFDKKMSDMADGKKLVKTSRLKLFQRVELRMSEYTFEKELNLLLVEKNGFSHYQYLDQRL